MIYQEVLTVNTERNSIRADIYGWSHEDPSLVRHNKPIGFTGAPKPRYSPDCVLKAMGNGWRLLGPPIPFEQTYRNEETDEPYQETNYEWWLVRDKEL